MQIQHTLSDVLVTQKYWFKTGYETANTVSAEKKVPCFMFYVLCGIFITFVY